MDVIVFWIIIFFVSVLSGILFWGMSNNKGQSIAMFILSVALMFLGLFWFLPALNLQREPGAIIVVGFIVLCISFVSGGLQSFVDCNNRRVNKA